MFAFGKRIALTNNPVVVRATAASALPKNQQIFGGPEGDYRSDLWSCRSAALVDWAEPLVEIFYADRRAVWLAFCIG